MLDLGNSYTNSNNNRTNNHTRNTTYLPQNKTFIKHQPRKMILTKQQNTTTGTTRRITKQNKKMATQLRRMSFQDTGRLNNATTKERENILALSMYYKLGRYDPSDKCIQTYKSKGIIKL